MVRRAGASKPCGKATVWHGRSYKRNKIYSRRDLPFKPDVESFAIGDFFFRQQYIALWSFALPADTILNLLVLLALVDDFIYKKFMLSINRDGIARHESSGRKKIVVVF